MPLHPGLRGYAAQGRRGDMGVGIEVTAARRRASRLAGLVCVDPNFKTAVAE